MDNEEKPCPYCRHKLTLSKLTLNKILGSGIVNGKTTVVDFALTNGADPNFTDKMGNTFMHHATNTFHKDIVSLLFQHGAIADTKNSIGKLPEDNINIVGDKYILYDELLKTESISKKQIIYENELYLEMLEAIENSNLTNIKNIVKRGIDVNDNDGEIIKMVVQKGNTEIIQFMKIMGDETYFEETLPHVW